MSCWKCRYEESGDWGDTCAKSRKVSLTPEGVPEEQSVSTFDALKQFRLENNGRCPHFRKRFLFSNDGWRAFCWFLVGLLAAVVVLLYVVVMCEKELK